MTPSSRPAYPSRTRGIKTRHALRLVAVLLFAGCVHKPAPIVTPEPPAQTATLSIVAAAVAQAAKDNAAATDSPTRQALTLLLRIAASGLPIPTAPDLARMADLSALVFAGKQPEAETKAAEIERELAALRAQIAKEREASAAQLRQILADADARIKAAEDAGTRKAFLILVTAASITGGLISLGGALMAWMTTYKILGGCFILIGPMVAGAALLWGKPWFYIPAGLGFLLLGLAFGIKLVWSILDRDGNGRLDILEKRKIPAEESSAMRT
jgi:hypothetical protein